MNYIIYLDNNKIKNLEEKYQIYLKNSFEVIKQNLKLLNIITVIKQIGNSLVNNNNFLDYYIVKEINNKPSKEELDILSNNKYSLLYLKVDIEYDLLNIELEKSINNIFVYITKNTKNFYKNIEIFFIKKITSTIMRKDELLDSLHKNIYIINDNNLFMNIILNLDNNNYKYLPNIVFSNMPNMILNENEVIQHLYNKIETLYNIENYKNQKLLLYIPKNGNINYKIKRKNIIYINIDFNNINIFINNKNYNNIFFSNVKIPKLKLKKKIHIKNEFILKNLNSNELYLPKNIINNYSDIFFFLDVKSKYLNRNQINLKLDLNNKFLTANNLILMSITKKIVNNYIIKQEAFIDNKIFIINNNENLNLNLKITSKNFDKNNIKKLQLLTTIMSKKYYKNNNFNIIYNKKTLKNIKLLKSISMYFYINNFKIKNDLQTKILNIEDYYTYSYKKPFIIDRNTIKYFEKEN